MNITLSVDDQVVKTVRKIAIDRDTTLTQLVRDYLTNVANTHDIDAKETARKFRNITDSAASNKTTKPSREDVYAERFERSILGKEIAARKTPK